MHTLDEQFMSIAIEIAARGRGAVEPNPMVGAVLVRGGEEISRGWHTRFGFPHAEVEALSAAEETGEDPHGATLYVSLEPCCHFGKTPPCTRAIIEAGISRVVAAMSDPDERVAGKGLDELRRAGIEVTAGVLEGRARDLLAPYIKLRKHKRPWVICKWAQTADGLLALPEGQGRWISCEASRQDVHRLRGQCDGICVGIGTALADDPMLTNRSGQGRQPARVVLDAHLRLPTGSWLVQTAKASPVLVATTLEGLAGSPGRSAELRGAGVEVVQLPAAAEGISLDGLLEELGRRQWTYLLVEGGARLLRSFVYGGLADELIVYVSPMKAGGGAGAARFDIAQVLSDFELSPVKERAFGSDLMRQFRMKR
jgi:diaminohydroxyphosphoribosylaminopyrimidine deaminase / 5-amino-6-(5-phosphoribosylamino)uracil reductase